MIENGGTVRELAHGGRRACPDCRGRGEARRRHEICPAAVLTERCETCRGSGRTLWLAVPVKDPETERTVYVWIEADLIRRTKR